MFFFGSQLHVIPEPIYPLNRTTGTTVTAMIYYLYYHSCKEVHGNHVYIHILPDGTLPTRFPFILDDPWSPMKEDY